MSEVNRYREELEDHLNDLRICQDCVRAILNELTRGKVQDAEQQLYGLLGKLEEASQAARRL